jgi:hypothetical protein
MKNKLTPFISLVLSITMVSIANAQTIATTTTSTSGAVSSSITPLPVTSSSTSGAANKVMTQAQHILAIQNRGNSDINNRVTSLNALIKQIENAKKISAAQKTDLINQIQAEIISITALEAQLKADNSLAQAKVDFQNIFAQHYIYIFYLPKIERIIAADAILQATSTFDSSVIPLLQGFINQVKTKGGDVTEMQTEISDLQTQITAANNLATAVINSLAQIQATQFKANSSIMKTSQQNLQSARADLETARSDSQSIILTLKKDLGK